MSTFRSVVEAEQLNGKPKKNRPFQKIQPLSLVWNSVRVFIFWKGRFFFGFPFSCSASTALRNVDTASYMILFSLFNFIVLLLFSSSTLLLSWVISLSITVYYIRQFRRLVTSGNTSTKVADNEVSSTGSHYSWTPLQSVKGLPSYSSVPHDRTDTYKASLFFELVA